MRRLLYIDGFSDPGATEGLNHIGKIEDDDVIIVTAYAFTEIGLILSVIFWLVISIS